MKRAFQFLLLSFCFVVTTFLSSCSTASTSNHETVWSSDGKDSVVNVVYVDNDGNQSNFFMNYLLFRNLYGSGGYSNVYNYYQNNPSQFASTSSYTNYKPKETSPSRSYTSPSRSFSSPSRSFSSPSRH